MEQVTATRTELLTRRAQIMLAVHGRDLLQEKRNELLAEFTDTADTVLSGSDDLEAAAERARRALSRAVAWDGPESVAAAALPPAACIEVTAQTSVVMGVSIPDIAYEPVGRTVTTRGYGVTGTTARLDAVATRFEDEVDLLLQVAAGEARLRRLAAEIGKTTRRVNALDHIVIPRLVAERDRIQSVLDEHEREDHFRLKRVKDRKARARRLRR